MTHHGRNLRQLTKDDALVEQLKTDYTAAPLRPADRAILDIAMITAYYAYVNRIADGLGVSLEDYWSRGDTPDA